MGVTDALMRMGAWDVSLSPQTPRDVLDGIGVLDHVVVTAAPLRPEAMSDAALAAARWVGVIRSRVYTERPKLTGASLALWLGDGDDKGPLIESALAFNAATFANTITALLPSAITAGTIHSVAGTYTGRHQYETPRKALDYVTGLFGAEWRINPNGTLDAGTATQLYSQTPKAIVVRRPAGDDLTLPALGGSAELTRDAEDYTTRVVLLAQGEGQSISTGSANAASVPYKDLHGNAARIVRVISESGTATTNASSRAQLHLNRFNRLREAVRLSADRYDVEGVVRPGENVYVYDPDAGFTDPANQVTFRGRTLNPAILRVTALTWPITEGMGVYHRSAAGVWTDLTQWVDFDSGGSTEVEVGDFQRTLTGGGTETVGSRPNVGDDGTTPAAPTLTVAGSSVYLDAEGRSRVRVDLSWTLPTNTDGSTITDGGHYEVHWRASTSASWMPTSVAWGTLTAALYDLSPGTAYQLRVRAVDLFGRAGAFSSTVSHTTTADTIAPSTPAAPTVATSKLAILVTHTLGKNTGGTYNLENDLAGLDVYVGTTSGFTPDATNLVGRIPVGRQNLPLSIPAVASFPVPDTTTRWVKVKAVDATGNASPASPAVSGTATLLDSAQIASLTADKIAAGTITASVEMTAATITGGLIRTAATGARLEITSAETDRVVFYDSLGAVTGRVGLIPGSWNVGPDGRSMALSSQYPIHIIDSATGNPGSLRVGHTWSDVLWATANQQDKILWLANSSATAGSDLAVWDGLNWGTGTVQYRFETNGKLTQTTSYDHPWQWNYQTTEMMRWRLTNTLTSPFLASAATDVGVKFYGGLNRLEVRNYNDAGWRDIAASAFTVSSAPAEKSEPVELASALSTVRAAKAYSYTRADDPTRRTRRGLMAPDLPPEIRGGGDDVDLYALVATLWRAVQELDARVRPQQ